MQRFYRIIAPLYVSNLFKKAKYDLYSFLGRMKINKQSCAYAVDMIIIITGSFNWSEEAVSKMDSTLKAPRCVLVATIYS
jgi:hypothetical protein